MISIIIVSYNQKKLLKQCIDNIFKSDIKNNFEIIIVDNDSKDNTRKYLQSINDKRVSVILNKDNLGYAKANNQGIKRARGEYILLLNPDVIIYPNSVEVLAQFLKTHKNVAMVGPRLLNVDGSVQGSCCRFPKLYTPIARRTILGRLPILQNELDRYLMKDFDHENKREVDWMIGACLMIKKDILEKVGLLDERYFLYFEDVDLARKFWTIGKKVYYLPESRVTHAHQRLSANKNIFSKVVRIHILSGIKYFLKWGLTKLLFFSNIKKRIIKK